MTDSTSILTSFADGILSITLNRPDKLNSFNDAMHLEFRAALQRAHDDSAVRAVFLTGAGRAFCAGQDLDGLVPEEGAAIDLGETIEKFYNPALRLIRDLEKPIICAVNAAARGGSLHRACTMSRAFWVPAAMINP